MREILAGCCQFESIPGDVDGNLIRAEMAVAGFAGEGSRLLILPEMWSCSFPFSSLDAMAERTPAVLEEIRGWAAKHGMVLLGSLPEADGGAVYNTSYVIERTGKIVGTYRKIHRFSFYGEDRYFGRGTKPLLCSTSVGKLGVMICYDLRFPELARRLALDGADIICISALWPVERIDHWSLLLRCRAVENQLFVVGCNGCGREGRLRYGGKSALISPTGKVLAEAGSGEELAAAKLEMGEITTFRKYLTCFEDRLPGAYGRF